MIHNREADAEVLDVLRAEGAPDVVIFHCFSSDSAMARRCVDAGWLLSLSGTADQAVVAQLLANPYFDRPPPKSLDRQDFGMGAVEGLAAADEVGRGRPAWRPLRSSRGSSRPGAARTASSPAPGGTSDAAGPSS